ncbi:hypothetical protein [Paenibacillus radicis (ex Gao et al. 2016)]|uniref:hypothetical protein n=1 Tax=Paenibacillus radicis (ex Gao et al. 2016) TaxID=1737354 RepID=UPI00166970F8|nr:hypothetical protein [Paenibacillus radicis (ex Gao et al. 2016)]
MERNLRLFVTISHARRCRLHRQRPADRLAKPEASLEESSLSASDLPKGSIRLPQESGEQRESE